MDVCVCSYTCGMSVCNGVSSLISIVHQLFDTIWRMKIELTLIQGHLKHCKFSVIENEGLAAVFRDHRHCGNRVGAVSSLMNDQK